MGTEPGRGWSSRRELGKRGSRGEFSLSTIPDRRVEPEQSQEQPKNAP
ncbi:hypothetical protein Nmel_003509 [Mimus melanotis]